MIDLSENTLFEKAMQTCPNYPHDYPAVVLLGYSKLLIMDEKEQDSLLTESEKKELDTVRPLFKKESIDPGLIKAGVPMLISLMRHQIHNFEDSVLLMSAGRNITSSQVIIAAFGSVDLEFKKAFHEGNNIGNVIGYQFALSHQKRDDSGRPGSVSQKPAEKTHPDRNSGVTKKTAAPADQNTDDKQDFFAVSERYAKLSRDLLSVVKGQDAAVSKFVRGCFMGELFTKSDRDTPLAYFFFFGPPGVGKTFLAETAAKNMDRPSKFFNMSEYALFSSYEQLVGFSSTFKNSQKGILTDFVRENPNSILIFDEIEKASLGVIRLFLQILGSGKLTDAYTKQAVSFRDTILIFTSNVGKKLYEDRSIHLSNLPEKVILDTIQNEKDLDGDPVLSPEICSRIAAGNMIMFDHLSISRLSRMINDSFQKVVRQMDEEYNCTVTYDPNLPMLFLHNRGGEIDARIATSQSANFLKNELYELTRQLENCNDLKISSVHFSIEQDGMNDELKRLFTNVSKTEILVISDGDVAGCFNDSRKKYVIYHAETYKKAKEYLEHDISAVFIDPMSGVTRDSSILSISDYDSEGNMFFREMMRIRSGIPVYILDVNGEFSETDRRTFILEGAEDTIVLSQSSPESFLDEFEQIMEEHYIEDQNLSFSQKGWVIDFGTRQTISEYDHAEISFYDLRKTLAVDEESRDTVLRSEERPDVRFDDVIGAEKAKDELSYFIDYLKNPKRFLSEGGKQPQGVLLYGPPGTGKTMLARAMAGESDVTFIQTTAASFKDKYHGGSEENIRNIFRKARRYAPSILFIDEIDAIGRKRTGSEFTSVDDSTLTTLLTEMDGFAKDSKKPVFVLAATNFGVRGENDVLSGLDPALIRRFDNRIYVDLPNEEERKTYIKRLIKTRKMSGISDEIIDNIAERTTGQSLAIIQNVVDLAYRNAVKEHRSVTGDDLLNSLEEYLYGEKKERDIGYYRKVAVHETGHAYISYICGDKPSYITIESRGSFGGYMQHSSREDVPEYSKDDLINRIRISLAGRAAESVFFGTEDSLNTGASSDLENATNLAWDIICRYGMEDGSLIVLSRDDILKSPLAADYVARVNELLKKEMDATVRMISDGKEKIQSIADMLVKKNKLTGQQFEDLMST